MWVLMFFVRGSTDSAGSDESDVSIGAVGSDISIVSAGFGGSV